MEAGVTAGSTAVALDDATVAFRLADARVYTAVEQVRLSVEHGEFVAIVGPTGCGKSTLLNVAAGLLRPSSGTVRIFDSPLAGLNREAGYLFQADALFPWKTAIDNVAIGLEVSGVPRAQALERAQGFLRLPDGKAVNGFSHCYKRHGTTTLFAALEIATGQVKTAHYGRRRRREFLEFMNDMVAENPNRKIHVVLDNLNTHKPKEDRWLKRHSNVQLHFTPTYSSWLNQVECWFSILARQALRGASFTSPRQLRQAIDDFVSAYNQTAAPFEWKKAVVFRL